MRYVIAAIALLTLGFVSCAVAHHDIRAEVMRTVSTGAVKIYTSDGMGSGTVISRRGNQWLILTCEHVVAGDALVYVETLSGRFPATVLKTDVRKDLAVLVARGDIGAIPVRIAHEDPRLYERMYVVSSPLGINNTGSEGILYSKAAELRGDDLSRWAFTGFILPGSSGGTITNAEGELVCVAEAIKRGPEILPLIPELAFCVGLPDIKAFTKEYEL